MCDYTDATSIMTKFLYLIHFLTECWYGPLYGANMVGSQGSYPGYLKLIIRDFTDQMDDGMLC